MEVLWVAKLQLDGGSKQAGRRAGRREAGADPSAMQCIHECAQLAPELLFATKLMLGPGC